MGNDADRSPEGDTPMKPPVTLHDGGDDSSEDLVDAQARLSQSIWFLEDETDGSNGAARTVDAAATAIPSRSRAELQQDGQNQDLTIPPIVQTADAGPPVVEVARGEPEKVPANLDGGNESNGETSKLAGQIDDPQLEAFRKTVIEADKNEPLAIQTLTTQRKTTLESVGRFVKATDNVDAAGQEIAVAQQQELNESALYLDYLKPGTERTNLATALISRGDDESVREGERLLLDAVDRRPDLIFHPNFRSQVIDAYGNMTRARQDKGLPQWNGDILIPEVPGSDQPTDKDGKSAAHFEKANEQFFGTGGIDAAMPEFNKAIESADQTQRENAPRLRRERLELLADALKTDRSMVQRHLNGESITELEKHRVDVHKKQVENYIDDSVGARARMNVGLAMIASGKPDMLSIGMDMIAGGNQSHPGLLLNGGLAVFSNQFNEQLFGAFRAHHERQAGTDKPADSSDGAAPSTQADKAKIGYQELDLENLPVDTSVANDPEYQAYKWDRATDIALPVAVVGMALYTGVRQYRNWQHRRAVEREYKLETPKTADVSETFVRKGPNGQNERVELLGRTQSGRAIVKNLEQGAGKPADPKLGLEPPKNFKPEAGEFADYEPVKVGKEKYYLNNKGEVFTYQPGNRVLGKPALLLPTDAIRVVAENEVTSRQLKELPADMTRNPIAVGGEKLTPLGALNDGRIVLRASGQANAALTKGIAIDQGVDPIKNGLEGYQRQRISGQDYFISQDNKAYTFNQKSHELVLAHDIKIKSAQEVFRAEGAPGTSASERAINRQVNQILEPLRQQLRAGEYVDPRTKLEYLKQAKEALLPYAKQTARDLGMPEGVMTDRTLRYSEVPGTASHDSRTGEVTIDIFSDNHVTAVDHELKHKQRTLDMVAAAEADPRGYRLAMVDQALKDIGKPGRRFSDGGIDNRPKITSPEAVTAMREIVRNHALYAMAERGTVPWSDVNLEAFGEKTPRVLLTAFGSEENVYLEIAREVENLRVLEKNNVLSREQLNDASRQHIDRRVEFHKQWLAEHPSLSDSPHVNRLMEGVNTDTLGLYHVKDATLRPYYKFSSDEIAARKQQIGRALRRLRNELAEIGDTRPTSIREHPEGKQLFERGEIATGQQRLLGKLNQGDTEGAKVLARDLLTRMEADPERYVEDVRFMQEKELLTEQEVRNSRFKDLMVTAGKGLPSMNDIELQRVRQQNQTRIAMAERVEAGDFSGNNLEQRKALENGGYEYRLKQPVTVDSGTDVEVKVLAIVEKDGKLHFKYQNREGKVRVDADVYSDYLRAVEIATERPGNPRSTEERARIASDFLEDLQAREKSQPLTSMDEFNKAANGVEARVDLQRLEEFRARIVAAERQKALSSQKGGDRVQIDVYEVLNGSGRNNAGLMDKLKQGMEVNGRKLQISGDWELYPTRSGSPADRIGADYLLVNKKTGEFHFMDATGNADKKNVFTLREQGVIDVSKYNQMAGTGDKPGFIFDRGGSLEWSGNPNPTEPAEIAAKKFYQDLAVQINELTETRSGFKLGETPMPDIVAITPEQEKPQIERLIEWAREQARINNEPATTDPNRRGSFTDMAETLEKRALRFVDARAREVMSEPFEQQVRSVSQREIARFIAHKHASGRNQYDQIRSTSANPNNVYANNDRLKFESGTGEILMTSKPIAEIMNHEFTELQNKPERLLSALSGKEIRNLNPRLFESREFQKPDGRPLADKALKSEVIKAFQDSKHPQHQQVKRLISDVVSTAYSVKAIVLNGGAEGRGRPVITDNMVATLKDRPAARLQGIEEVSNNAKPEKPAEVVTFGREFPKLAADLKELVTQKERFAVEYKQEVMEALEVLQEFAEAKEKAKFEELMAKYKAKDAKTIEYVHKFLNGEEPVSERPVSELRESSEAEKPAARLAPATISPVSDLKISEFQQLMRGLEGLDRGRYLSQAVEKARNTLKGNVSFSNRTLFNRTAIDVKESASLKPGESELLIVKGDQVVKPASFRNGNIVTEGGAEIPIKDVKMEIRVGTGSSADQAARETLIRVNDLAGMLDNRAGNSETKSAEAAAVRERFGAVATAEGHARAGQDVATRVKQLGAFDFGQTKQIKVELTQSGVRFGEHGEIAYRDLVQETIRKKQAELAELKRQKGESHAEVREMEGRVAELQKLERAVQNNQGGEVAKLMEAIEKSSSPREIARLRREMARGPGYVKAGVGTFSAVAMVGAFVATLLVSGESGQEVLPTHINWKAAG